jgi:hypothetical protein
MLSEPTGVLWFVVGTMGLSGLGLLLARYGFAPASALPANGLRGAIRNVGVSAVILTGVLTLYLLPILIDGPRSGGLGSMGDPFGALLMLGYLFVLAPLTLLASAILGIVYWVRRQRDGHSIGS